MRAEPAERIRRDAAGRSLGGAADRITQSECSAASRCTRGPLPATAMGMGSSGWNHGRDASPTVSPASRRRLSSNVSRSAVKGRSGSIPRGWRTRLPPTPRPCITRPGASSASVAMAAAVATGWRLNGLVMAGATLSPVASTMAVSAT